MSFKKRVEREIEQGHRKTIRGVVLAVSLYFTGLMALVLGGMWLIGRGCEEYDKEHQEYQRCLETETIEKCKAKYGEIHGLL